MTDNLALKNARNGSISIWSLRKWNV